MMRRLQLLILIILLLSGLFMPAEGEKIRSREALREEYLSILHKENSAVYVNEPSVQNPYAAGSLTEEALSDALLQANFIRWLAGLEPLELDGALNDLTQHGAVLMAANGELSHAPHRPEDMDEVFFRMGEKAAASCNLVMYNWTEEDILEDAVEQFACDDGASNQHILGHRRWLLYPAMKYTGFGLAQDESGRSYAAMYVMDASNRDAEYDMVCWPSAGAFPAEFMTADMSWSITPNPQIYDLEKTSPRIAMTEQTTGAEYVFEIMTEEAEGEQYFVLGGGRYGDGPTYIFRPDLSEYDELMYGYEQNQVWTVRVDGMILKDGTQIGPVEYTVEMASLTPIDPAAVEIMPRELTLKAGQSARLSAQVIPDWADDLSIIWSSSDEEVAFVDGEGTIYGRKAGKCRVCAESVNGRKDEIEITVE